MHIPFDHAHQLYDMAFSSQHHQSSSNGRYLPGQPRIMLGLSPEVLYDYLEKDLCTRDLNIMSPHLWLMATRSSKNVSPLHHQKVKGRHIILTEDPRLHLLWIDDRIFIKPLPPYLLSYEFCERYLFPEPWPTPNLSQKPPLSSAAVYPEWNARKEELSRSALGFLRSYFYLIKCSSDLEIALSHRLLPPDVTFETFCQFSSRFAAITDDGVAPRYHYGELRLGRLNLWCKLLLQRWHYETVYRQYGQYFQRFYGPLLFTFAFFSVALSTLQVELAVESVIENQRQWPRFWTFSRVFSVLSLAVVGLPFLTILALLIGKPLMELRYALTH